MFEDLLPEPHNQIVMNLLFLMAHWHGLAKLRLHTDDTLNRLDQLTSALGDQLRTFQKKTCSVFQTKELPRETRARARQQARQAAKNKGGNIQNMEENRDLKTETPINSKAKPFGFKLDRKSKAFNLHTYKNHALGDYVEMIRKYGTTDSYNTELVSCEQDFKNGLVG